MESFGAKISNGTGSFDICIPESIALFKKAALLVPCRVCMPYGHNVYELHKSNLPKYLSWLHLALKACLRLSILLGYPSVALHV